MSRSHFSLFAAALLVWSPFAVAGTVSPVQSSRRPYGLDIVGPVMLAGSDADAADFQQNVLPVLQQSVNQNLGERQPLGNVGTIALDPGAMTLQFDSDVRTYFVGEGAGYHNALGFMTTPYDAETGLAGTDARLIFPDASSNTSFMGGNSNVRTANAPLMAGDFVDLGTIDAGETITPFILANGTTIYTPDPTQNPDGIQHFVSLSVSAVVGSSYLLVGVEDLFGGGDEDYNDLVFALDIGTANVQHLVSAAVPLPPMVFAVLGPCGFACCAYLRRRRAPADDEAHS